MSHDCPVGTDVGTFQVSQGVRDRDRDRDRDREKTETEKRKNLKIVTFAIHRLGKT